MKIGYARVSTEDQSLDLQKDALKKDGCERIFQDVASGKNTDRPGLQEALDFARGGDVIVSWKLDRIGRSLIDVIKLIQDLDKRDIAFVSLQDGIDTSNSSPMARFVLTIFAALAELERDIIRERTRAGLAAARARGRKGGRPPKLSRDQVEMLRQLHSNPANSIDQICEMMNIHRNTLYKYLKSENIPLRKKRTL